MIPRILVGQHNGWVWVGLEVLGERHNNYAEMIFGVWFGQHNGYVVEWTRGLDRSLRGGRVIRALWNNDPKG